MKAVKQKLLVIGLTAILALSACQRAPGSGLQTASDTAVSTTTGYPAVVEIILPGGYGLCSGTFIGPRAILTAAHCAKANGTYQIISSFGNFTATIHETYGPGVVNDPNDIAVLVLNRDVASTRYTQIVPIGTVATKLDEVRLVGFGCTNLETQAGMGQKRTGTNQIAEIDDYLNLDTPASTVGILGASNRAGTCFGDSGGPLMRNNGQYMELIGVTHAGGLEGAEDISQYANLTRSDNRSFLQGIDSRYNLNIFTSCSPDGYGASCSYETAGSHIMASLLVLWHKFLAIWF